MFEKWQLWLRPPFRLLSEICGVLFGLCVNTSLTGLQKLCIVTLWAFRFEYWLRYQRRRNFFTGSPGKLSKLYVVCSVLLRAFSPHPELITAFSTSCCGEGVH